MEENIKKGLFTGTAEVNEQCLLKSSFGVSTEEIKGFYNGKTKIILEEQIREKSKGCNHDLLAMECKMLKAKMRYTELKEQVGKKVAGE